MSDKNFALFLVIFNYNLIISFIPSWSLVAVPDQTCTQSDITLSEFTDGGCPLQRCWEVYQDDLEAAGLQDDLMWSDRHRSSPKRPENTRKLCQVMSQYDACTRLAHQKCVGNLKYHSVRRRIERNLRQLGCHRNTSTWEEDSSQGDQGDLDKRNPDIPSDVCRFKSVTEYRFCSVFGDPHVRTLSGTFQTCNIRGTRPMIDNEYVTVQITNTEMTGGLLRVNGTTIEKLTVVIKKQVPCGPDHYLTYQAQAGQLPLTFDDGRSRINGVEIIQHPPPDDHIEITLRYANIFIIIRSITRQSYTVGVALPADLVSSHYVINDQSARLQLCHAGCGKDESVDIDSVLSADIPKSSKTTRTVTNGEKTGSKLSALTLQTALARCREMALTGYYFKSCMFDLLATGDVIFTTASRDVSMDTHRFLGNADESHLTIEDQVSFLRDGIPANKSVTAVFNCGNVISIILLIHLVRQFVFMYHGNT